MGDRATNATRAQAEQAAIEVLAPETRVIGDLAVAARAAGEADELRAAARAKGKQLIEAAQARADQLLAEAETEVERRFDHWRQQWQAAKNLGWTPRRLRANPINQLPPPMTRRSRKAKTEKDGPSPTTTTGPGTTETSQSTTELPVDDDWRPGLR